jgi:hypothetical protein
MRSSVVMDVAAVKVSHSVGIDEDATALRAARARSSSIYEGRWMKVQNTSAHLLQVQNYEHAHISQSIHGGNMDASSEGVQDRTMRTLAVFA